MSLSDISIRNPVFAWMLMLALIVFGAISFSRLGVSQLPDADFPVLNVAVELEGAAPEIIETTVVDPIEDSLMSIEGVRSISSNSKSGGGNITIEFDLGRNIDVALQEVQTKVAQAQRLLPNEVKAPVITKTNPDDQPILWLALTSKSGDLKFLNQYARNFVKDKFTVIPGVGDIFLGGYTNPALRVWVEADRLPQYNISVNDIIDAIKTEHTEIPGGQIETPEKMFNVRTLGEAKTVPEFENITISRRAGQLIADPLNMVRLKQVSRIEEGLDEVRRIARFDGTMALGLGIKKQRGSNAVEVARAVKAKVEEMQKELPEGIELRINFDSTRFIEASIHELNQHLFVAALLTSIVCLMFLGSWTATFNVLLSIPTSIFGAFIGLYFFGFTLNTFTLLGLTLAIGIVVDDAIMVLENIFRYNEKGHGRIQSAILGAREISFAAMAATVAVIAIFLPVAFMKGVIGKFFMQFGVTISLAVLLSLLEALTITPMRCASFVSQSHNRTRLGQFFERIIESMNRFYAAILRPTLNHPWKVIMASVLFLISSFYLVKYINKEFAPVQDQSIFLMRLQMPVGSSLAATNDKVKLVEKWLKGRSEIKQVFASVGGFSGSTADSNIAMIFVTMVPKKDRKISQQDFMELARKELLELKPLKVFMQDLSMRGFTASRGFPVEFTVQGGDWDILWGSTEKLMKEMEKSGLMADIDSNYLLGMPEVQIRPDRIQAALHGVSASAIGTTVNALIGGVIVGQYSKEGQRYDVRLQLTKSKSELEEVKNLMIGNSRNNLIPLSRVVKQETKPSLQQISRINRQRAISVFANLKPGVSQTNAIDFVQKTAKATLPSGYFVSTEGSAKNFKEAGQGLILALVLGILVAYMILATQFKSYIDPVSILLSMPFSISGAFMALLLTGQSLNMYSMIGILLLMGIVKKNSILLVEFANQVREQKNFSSAKMALLEACPIRLRPILMTSLATMAGAVPSAVARGEGAEAFRPMAITIIGGVFVSTLLTLVVVPAAYLLFDKIRRRDKSQQEIHQAFVDVESVAH